MHFSMRYFSTTVPGAGIFLPLHRATKRTSGTSSSTFPPTPHTSSFPSYLTNGSDASPPPPSVPKFSQSVGPGARAPSPVFKPKSRPSLPRPESPFRKQPTLAATPGRPPAGTPVSFSRSQVGAPPRFSSSPAPSKFTNKAATPSHGRPYSRNNSRLGEYSSIEEDFDTTPTGKPRGMDTSITSPKPRGSNRSSSESQNEVVRLNRKLEERDKQLKEQASSLAEMEASLTELQRLMPTDGTDSSLSARNGQVDDGDAAQLRVLLREKNEKISMLTAEFDAHRADFRSTIDTLEMASTETVRVYEKKVNELVREISELQERGEDVESVATQLKQLEDLVQELEEGLEDARRGEAEARGEVEFLRGEVERGRSELRREREKAAAALKGAGAAMDGANGSREVEQRDDEIRGLKAIIHSLSSGSELGNPMKELSGSPNRRNAPSKLDHDELNSIREQLERVEREKKELQGLVERKTFREEELEKEMEQLRATAGGKMARDSMMSNAQSEKTVQEKHYSGRDSKGTVLSWRTSNQMHRPEITPRSLQPMTESDTQSSMEGSVLWCEICETGGHDILNCNAMGSNGDISRSARANDGGKNSSIHAGTESSHEISHSTESTPRPAPLAPNKVASPAPSNPLPNPYDSSLVAGKGSVKADPSKWCALCERDGHDVTVCPFEDAY